MQNPFESAMKQLRRAAAARAVPHDLLLQLSQAEREIAVSIPVVMDDGTLRLFEGYRVQYSSLCGPYKGGIRFHPETDINEVRALAFWMSIKCAISGIPMGGGKGGVTVDAKKLSRGELERLSRGWVRRLYPVLGPDKDVPAPDVGTTPEVLAWMADEYEMLTGDNTGAAFTGKPLARGGSEGRALATGMGGFYVFDAARARLQLPSSCRIAIQGMGNVGGNAGIIFRKQGHRVIAISDSKGGIRNENGIDIEAVEQYKKEHGSLNDFPGAAPIQNEELLELPCDVLIPAALENQITEKNAARIRARAVLELANGPTTPEADDILHERGVAVIPDVLANAGGVIVSTFEWEQNRAGEHWSEEAVFKKLHTMLAEQTGRVFALADTLQSDLRRAAFSMALERLEEAAERRSSSSSTKDSI